MPSECFRDILAVFLFYGGEKMANWTCSLFKEDLYNKDFIELADWLEACRNYVEPDKDMCDEYLFALDDFCKEWEEHYNYHNATYENDSIYRSETFYKALGYIWFKERLTIICDYGEGQYVYPADTYNNLKSSVISSGKSFERIRGLYDETHEAVQKAFENDGVDFKEKIHGYISNQSFDSYKFYIRVLKDGKQLTSKTYKEFMEQCEKAEWYVEEYEFIEKKNNYNNALKEFGISKSVYNDWRSEAYCEKDFGKKMFVNMAFILGLNYENAEKLLNLNGYTFESVGRQFDEICRKAFKIGFSRDMTIALIEKRNRELAKSNIKFALIPNLTSNKQ